MNNLDRRHSFHGDESPGSPSLGSPQSETFGPLEYATAGLPTLGFPRPRPPPTYVDTTDSTTETETGTSDEDNIECLNDEPDLELTIYMPECWTMTVGTSTLNHMDILDQKRQNAIWELIREEKRHVRRLKILQKIFVLDMVQVQNFTEDQIERLFPKLKELLALHRTFLLRLLARQALTEDRSIEDIGELLVDQFQGKQANEMKSVYASFCSRVDDARLYYKEVRQADKTFRLFVNDCARRRICRRMNVSDYLQKLNSHLTDYSSLIKRILQYTRDQKETERISRALTLSRGIVDHVNNEMRSYETLLDIQSRLETRRAVIYGGERFRCQDLTARYRHLLHSGTIDWKDSRRRVHKVFLLILIDMVVFLQQQEQKFTFFIHEDKACVLSLRHLLVTEKNDSKKHPGIFLIDQDPSKLEMYTLVCDSEAERDEWKHQLNKAIGSCQQRDKKVQALASAAPPPSQPLPQSPPLPLRPSPSQPLLPSQSSQPLPTPRQSLLQRLRPSRPAPAPPAQPTAEVAMRKKKRVKTKNEKEVGSNNIFSSVTPLGRHDTSVGERASQFYVDMSSTKRAESFAGFNSPNLSRKDNAKTQYYMDVREEEEEEEEDRGSCVSLDQIQLDLVDSGHLEGPNDLTSAKNPSDKMGLEPLKGASSSPQMEPLKGALSSPQMEPLKGASSSPQLEPHTHQCEKYQSPDSSSDVIRPLRERNASGSSDSSSDARGTQWEKLEEEDRSSDSSDARESQWEKLEEEDRSSDSSDARESLWEKLEGDDSLDGSSDVKNWEKLKEEDSLDGSSDVRNWEKLEGEDSPDGPNGARGNPWDGPDDSSGVRGNPWDSSDGYRDANGNPCEKLEEDDSADGSNNTRGPLWEKFEAGDSFNHSNGARDGKTSLLSRPLFDMEQITSSVRQLVQHLNGAMDIMSRQNTHIQSLQVELKQAKKEIKTLSMRMHGAGQSSRPPDQMDDLRRLLGDVTLEKVEWEGKKASERAVLEMERKKIEEEKKELEKEKEKLKGQLNTTHAQKGSHQSGAIRSYASPHQDPFGMDMKEEELMDNVHELNLQFVDNFGEKIVGGRNEQWPSIISTTSPTQKTWDVPFNIQQPHDTRRPRSSGKTRAQSAGNILDPKTTSRRKSDIENSRSIPSNLDQTEELDYRRGQKSPSPSRPAHKAATRQPIRRNGGGGPAPGAPASESEWTNMIMENRVSFV